MKIFTNYLKTIALVLVLGSAISAKSQCAANFTWTIGSNGAVTFTSTSIPTSSATTFYWNFGNNTTAQGSGTAGVTTSTTYSTNGSYVVTLYMVSSVPSCSSNISYTINITNASGCALIANFGYSQGSNGLVNFNNTSTGTAPGVTYSWNYGDASPLGNTTSPSHTYPANGSYIVTLTATNSSTCISTKTLMVNITTICNLNASFSTTMNANGSVSFKSTSTGTVSGSVYYWIFGDGANITGGPTVSHTYINGNYFAILTVINNSISPNCQDSVGVPISVTNNTCNLSANFTQTVGAGGVVSFASTSSGTGGSTSYTWNFGNGMTSNVANPIVTYPSNGTYYVILQTSNGANCNSTITKSVGVTTGTCVANANFTLVPTNTPQYWFAIPAYPWNITNATWSWGDNSTSTFSMYASHQYSAAGMYQICLTVTATCGPNQTATATACTSYSVYRGPAPAAIINVNVNPPALVNIDAKSNVGILNANIDGQVYQIYPNPTSGTFNLKIEGLASDHATVEIYNLMGEVVYSKIADTSNGEIFSEIALNNASSGVYFVQVNSNDKTFTRKLVISK